MELSKSAQVLIRLLVEKKTIKIIDIQEALNISLDNLEKAFFELKDLNINIFFDKNKFSLKENLCLLDLDKVQGKIPFAPIYYFYKIDSTNLFLAKNSQLSSGTLCIAESQQKGKGRRNNQWFSPFAKNLYYSLLWETNQPINKLSSLSPLLVLALYRALAQLKIEGLNVKWPNDLYLNGKKLAGILIDVSFMPNHPIKLIIGIGLNLISSSTDQVISIDQNWTTLQESGFQQIDKHLIIIEISKQLHQILHDFEKEKIDYLVDEFNQYDIFYNQPVQLINNQKQLIYGINHGINSKGEILISKEQSLHNYAVGDLSLRKL